MPSRIVRPILVVFVGLTLAAAGWQIARLDRELDVRSTAEAAVATALADCRIAMLDLRAVQRAYIVPGQDVRFWRDRAAANLAAIDACTAALGDRASSIAAAQGAVARLKSAVNAVRRLDGRMADLAGTGLRDHAHDLLYADAIRTSVDLERELGAVNAAFAAATTGTATPIRMQQATAAGAAALAALFGGWLIGRLSRGTPAAASLAAGESAAAEAGPVPATGPGPDVSPWPKLGERAASPAALQAAAEVCGALARVQQPLELAGLVERMHGVLDSRGTIVWIFDEAADALRPGLSAGYAPTAIGRMGSIPLSSDTPVAHAFTRGEARSVRGNPETPGALVVPIIAPAGVAGVITVELPPGNDRQPATLALSRIFAAQLAGLLGVTPRPADVDGPEIVMTAAAGRAATANGDARSAPPPGSATSRSGRPARQPGASDAGLPPAPP